MRPELERRVSEGGFLIELLLPRTDAGVLAQVVTVAIIAALLWRPARRIGLLQLWVGVVVFTGGLMALRALH